MADEERTGTNSEIVFYLGEDGLVIKGFVLDDERLKARGSLAVDDLDTVVKKLSPRKGKKSP